MTEMRADQQRKYDSLVRRVKITRDFKFSEK